MTFFSHLDSMATQNIVTTLSDGVLSKSCFESRHEQNTFFSPHSTDIFTGPPKTRRIISGVISPLPNKPSCRDASLNRGKILLSNLPPSIKDIDYCFVLVKISALPRIIVVAKKLYALKMIQRIKYGYSHSNFVMRDKTLWILSYMLSSLQTCVPVGLLSCRHCPSLAVKPWSHSTVKVAIQLWLPVRKNLRSAIIKPGTYTAVHIAPLNLNNIIYF